MINFTDRGFREFISEYSKEIAREVCRYIGVRPARNVECQFTDLRSTISILEARKAFRGDCEDINLFLLLCNEVYDLKNKLGEEGK